MTQFKAGDRVIFYSIFQGRVIATVIEKLGSENLLLDIGDGLRHPAHPKQCRHIKTKVKPREFNLVIESVTWPSENEYPNKVLFRLLDKVNEKTPPFAQDEAILVREIRKKR